MKRMRCQKRILPRGMSLHFRQCKNSAVEGTDYCHAHKDKPKPAYKPDPYKMALYVAGLRAKGKKNATDK